MFKKMFQKIGRWWYKKIKLIEMVEKHRKELESGTEMRGGSFLNMAEKGGKDACNSGHGRDTDGVQTKD